MRDAALETKPTQDRRLTFWSRAQAAAFGIQPVVATHRLHQLELFSDAALIDLLDSCPRDQLQVFTMGTDPLSWQEWQPVDTAGVSGRELFLAIARGRLWCHVLRVQLFDQRYRALVERLYADLSEQCPHFRPFRTTSTLLISSPTAMVYYHVDAEPNLLWHIRGAKRVWVYPAGDRELISPELMEDIFAHVMDEEVPYEGNFDRKAVTFDLGPGEVIAWPQNAPHRVTNLAEINVSLSTLHDTEDSDRRKLVYCANRLFRRTYHLPVWSTKETGMLSYAKRVAYRVWRRVGLLDTPPRRAYMTTLRVDPDAPNGVSPLPDGPVLTEFSQKEFSLEKDAAGQMAVIQRNQVS